MDDRFEELHFIYKMIGAYGFATVKELLEKYEDYQQRIDKANAELQLLINNCNCYEMEWKCALEDIYENLKGEG